MATEIKFGTSGWRAIVAEEFTLANIRRAVTGIASYVASQPGSHRMLVGRDPRFLGEIFVDEAARLLAQHGVTPVIIPDAAPTPAIAYAIRQQKASGGDQLTELFGKYGSFYPVRENFRLTDEGKQKFTEKVKKDPTELAGLKMKQVVRTDGLKLIFEDGSWVCYRLSGTEPVVRAYTEARDERESAALTQAAKDWVLR